MTPVCGQAMRADVLLEDIIHSHLLPVPCPYSTVSRASRSLYRFRLFCFWLQWVGSLFNRYAHSAGPDCSEHTVNSGYRQASWLFRISVSRQGSGTAWDQVIRMLLGPFGCDLGVIWTHLGVTWAIFGFIGAQLDHP